MTFSHRGVLRAVSILVLAGAALAPAAVFAQTSTAKAEQWIHVRVESKDSKGEVVRVNVPIEMAEKVLPAINKDKLHNGKVRFDSAHMDDIDVRALLDAVRTSKDGEYVTVQSNENDVRVAKSGGYLYIHVTDRSGAKHSDTKESAGKSASAKEEKVEIKIPMKVVDALFSAGKDELDVLAALRALAGNGDKELVSVKDSENTVRVWVDSKNVTD